MDIFLFFMKSGFIIVLIWFFYKGMLENESFYAANRIFFMGSLLLIFGLPFLNLPQLINHQGFVSAYFLEFASSYIQPLHMDTYLIPESDEDSYFKEKGLLFWVGVIYIFGFVVLIMNLFIQIFSISMRAVNHSDKIEDEGWTIVNMKGQTEPSSFFRYIFINPASYDYDTYEQILAHEKIHVKQKHSIDILLSELVICFHWFNPFAWLLKKEIEKNIEYQTDEIYLNRNPSYQESYQLSLLKVANHKKPISVVTSYNQSLIKQRICKINSKRSNNYSYWKYTFFIPLLFISALMLNQPMRLMGSEKASPLNVLSENEFNCEQILAAAKAEKTEEVGKLISKMDPSCLRNSVQQDYDNIAFAKYLVNHKAEVSVDLWNKKIIIEGYQLQIIDTVTDGEPVASVAPEDGLKVHSDCNELDIAISRGEKNKVRQLLLDLEENCLVDPTSQTLKLLEQKKKLIRDGADISLTSVQVIIPFEDLGKQ